MHHNAAVTAPHLHDAQSTICTTATATKRDKNTTTSTSRHCTIKAIISMQALHCCSNCKSNSDIHFAAAKVSHVLNTTTGNAPQGAHSSTSSSSRSTSNHMTCGAKLPAACTEHSHMQSSAPAPAFCPSQRLGAPRTATQPPPGCGHCPCHMATQRQL